MEAPQPALRGEGLPPAWKAAWAVFFLALWAVGLSLQNPGLMADDSGEMAAAAFCLGLPHPPGYPLVTLMGHLAENLPLGTPAFRLNLLSLALLMAAVGVILTTCRRLSEKNDPTGTHWAAREGALMVAGSALFFTRNVLGQAFTAKGLVYLLTLLVLSLLVDLYVSSSGRPKVKGLFLIVPLWALGLANHWQTQILWVPFLAWLFWIHRREMTVARWAVLGSLSLVGLSLYLVLPLRSAGSLGMRWGDPSYWAGFQWGVSRQLTSGNEWGGFSGNTLITYVRTLWEGSHPGLTCLGFLGLAAALWSKSVDAVLGFLLYLTMVTAMWVVPPRELIFLLPVYLVSTQGLIVLAAWNGWNVVYRRLERAGGGLRVVLLMVMCLGFLAWVPWACRMEDKSRYFLAQDLGDEILQALPRDAFFLAEGDLTAFSVWYEKVALGKRPDVAMVPPQFFLHPWGWKQAVEQRPSLGKLDLAMAPPAVQWDAIRVSCGAVPLGAPGGLYLSHDRSWLAEAGPPWVREAVPCGLCWYASGVPVSVGEFRARWRDVLARRRLRVAEAPGGSRGDDVVSRQILRYHATDALAQARWLEDRGDDWGSLDALERGLRWEPSVPGLWAAAARSAGKLGYPEASVDLCQRGLALDPDSKELLQDLRYAGWLARREPTGGKAKYEGLLGHARALGWRVLAESFQSTKRRLAVSLETKGRIQ